MRLKFWIKNALLISGGLSLAAPVYVALMALQRPDFTLEDAYTTGTLYLWMFSGIMTLVLGMNLYVQQLNLSLSFGSTRREAFWGMVCYRLIGPAVIGAEYLLLYGLLGRGSELTPAAVLPLGLGLSYLMGAGGSLLGICYSKWGKKAYWLLAVFTMIASVAFVGMMIAVLLNGELEALFSGNTLGWIVLAVGIGAYLLSLIPERRAVYKFNVKL